MKLREYRESEVKELKESSTLEELSQKYYSGQISTEDYLKLEQQLSSRARSKCPSKLEKLLDRAAEEIVKQLQNAPVKLTRE